MTNYIQQKKASKKGWHNADIKAALEKKGWSLRGLSAANGLCPGTLGQALRKPYLRSEKIIASTIGVPPEKIWPERYLHPRHSKGGWPSHKAQQRKHKDTSSANCGNVKDQAGK